jgi:DNA-binding SARP family transcriptional activator
MIFRILGPLALANADHEAFSSRTREARILGVLLLQPSRSVQVDSLIDMLYDESPPPTARQQVQNCASKLRQRVAGWTGTDSMRIVGSGYVLDVAEDQVDARAFERLLSHARAAVAHGDHRAAATAYNDALALWRGEVLGNVDLGLFAPLKARLMELRRLAVEEWLEVDFRNRGAAVMSDLVAATSEYPLNERLVDLQMRVLAASGRTTEALHLFRVTRRRLIEEHGVEPGNGLIDLHTAILRGQTRAAEPAVRQVDIERWRVEESRTLAANAVAANAAYTVRTALALVDQVRGELDRTLHVLDSNQMLDRTSV